MRILFGYDGSECSDAALLHDLPRAGLPGDVDLLVLSVADVWLLPPASATADGARTPQGDGMAARARARAVQGVDEARRMAEAARERAAAVHPSWRIRAESGGDSPGWGLVKKASTWRAALLVVGSHGRSGVGKLTFGFVAQRVLGDAPCYVRIAPGGEGRGSARVRVVVGLDGSPGSDAALREVAKRNWPAGTQARVVCVMDDAVAAASTWASPDAADPTAWIRQRAEEAAGRLRDLGIDATATVAEGDPRRVLTSEAESWGADSIFVGTRGLRGFRGRLGSVSSAVAARAACSVEVVRDEDPAPAR